MPSRRARIAAILPLELEYSGRLLAGAIEYVRANRRVTLVDIPYSVDAPADLHLRPPYGFEAAFLWATREAGWVEDLLAAGVPLVAASGDWPVDKVPCVSFDSKAVVEAAVDHLAQRRPAAMLHLEFQSTGIAHQEARSRLFREAAARFGIAAASSQVFHPDDVENVAIAYRAPLAPGPERRLKALLRKQPKPVGVWCGEDTLGARVCEAATSLGLRIPEDVAVLGLGNFRAAQVCNPPLSSIPLPGEMIGQRACAALDRQLSGGGRFSGFIPVMPPSVVVRDSTLRSTGGDPLARALRLIERHACEGITVSEVAAAVDVSPQALHVRFIKEFGQPPGSMIRQTKLAAVKRWLEDPRLSIARIAQLCGYTQQSKFSNFIRRETGLSPRDWRKSQP
jgi:LacI family transcriptional regulator